MNRESVNRRAFVGGGGSAGFAALGLPGRASAAKGRFEIGATDWNLKEEGKNEAIAVAQQLGFPSRRSVGATSHVFAVRIPRNTHRLVSFETQPFHGAYRADSGMCFELRLV